MSICGCPHEGCPHSDCTRNLKEIEGQKLQFITNFSLRLQSRFVNVIDNGVQRTSKLCAEFRCYAKLHSDEFHEFFDVEARMDHER